MTTTVDRRQLALDTILGRPHRGIPIWLINPMEWRMIDRLAGAPDGAYEREPETVYRQMLLNVGSCMVDQWIPRNPLSMGAHGYEGDTRRTATTGGGVTELDGIAIREPEDVITHLEQIAFPRLEAALAGPDDPALAETFLAREREVQAFLGDDLLKVPYGCFSFPAFHYGGYGYGPYFMAIVLYPEVIERHFRLQADLAERRNRVIARAIVEGGLPPFVRLDHDMADSRGMLVRIELLDRIWLPHFVRSIQPALDAGIRLVWHCDGNLMDLVPRLLDAGLHGFQGFQYEDGMDYERICRMTTRDGEPLLLIGGVSVTTTLPRGTPADVRNQLDWLVRHAPPGRLFLGASSSITPGVPLENLRALADGFHHYLHAG